MNQQALQILGKVPSGLFIVTTAFQGKRAGFLASFVGQVSLDPVIFSVACQNGRYAGDLIKKAQTLAINVLPDSDKVLLKTFAKGHGPDTDPFAGLGFEDYEGIPLLKDAIGAVVLKVADQKIIGDHEIFYGAPVYGTSFDSELRPWVHVRKSAEHY